MRLFKIFSLMFIAVLSLTAQSTSSITGQVIDPGKAAVAGAEVVVRAVATGSEYRTTSNADGYYTVPALPPADYKVSARAAGFKTAMSEVITLDIFHSSKSSARLKTGGATCNSGSKRSTC